MTLRKILTATTVSLAPLLVAAQNTLETTTDRILEIVTLVIPIVGAFLIIYFFVGAWQYVSAKGDEESRTEARNRMIYAVIGMFVAFSIFGLVRLVGNTVGVSDNAPINLPGIAF
jgi:TRAP-type C4-dicarboxylate transport system permease small subunit